MCVLTGGLNEDGRLRAPRSQEVMRSDDELVIIIYNDDMYVRWMFTSFYIEENREDIIK